MKLLQSLNHSKSSKRARGDRGEPRVVLERRALLAARTLVDRMRSLYRELEQLTGAPIAVHRALACIGDEPGLPASKLADALGMQRPTVSHVLRYLTERGWIERLRSNDDQRSVRIFITAEGRQLLKATSGRAVGTLQRAVGHLRKGELTALATGLETLLTHLPTASPKPIAAGSRRARSMRGPVTAGRTAWPAVSAARPASGSPADRRRAR